jgi:hypothetical protein
VIAIKSRVPDSTSSHFDLCKWVNRIHAPKTKPHLSSNRRTSSAPLLTSLAKQHLLQRSNKRSVRRLRLEATVEEERVLTRPPGLSVRDTPSSNTNTVVKVKASLGDSLVVGSRSASNVKLGDSDLRSDSSKSLEGVGGAAGRGQVGLRANAVDGNAGGDPLLDFGGEAGELGVGGAVEVVVVDVELGVRCGLLGSVESDADEFLAQDLGEDGVAEGTVFGEDLVDDVPGEALALEVAGGLGDVVLDHLGELGLVGNALDPGRELGVPDESVATEHLAVLRSESGGLVGGVESEHALLSLNGIPLHAVEILVSLLPIAKLISRYRTCSPG